MLALLEPRLAPGALVAADDNSFPSMADYLAYVRDPADGCVSVSFPVEDSMEISSWRRALAVGGLLRPASRGILPVLLYP